MTVEKLSIHASFDPNSVGLAANQIFGLPFSVEESSIVLVPAPWDTTVSYGAGTKHGPAAIREASYQVDLFDSDNPQGWRSGIAMLDIPQSWFDRSTTLRVNAERYIEFLEEGGVVEGSAEMLAIQREINAAGEEFRGWMQGTTSQLLAQGKIVGVVGGDHSTPLGYMDALAKQHKEFGILQLDAHCDLRDGYEGFTYSHASIMFNALKIPQVKKLVQVGIRDYCQAEADLAAQSNGRVRIFTDAELQNRGYEGTTWKVLCQEIVATLPQQVYLSFDIDGLDPKLCPNTGTPVPGGLEFQQAVALIREVVKSGRQIIGFDLNEVNPGGESEWDANVGARMLFKICNLLLLGRR